MKSLRYLGILCGLTLAAAPAAALGFDVDWRVEAKGGFSAANVLHDHETCIVACEGQRGVVCFDLAGTERWVYPMTPPVTAAPAVADVNGDGSEEVVAADSTGKLVVLNREGTPIWTAQLPESVQADACPTVADLDQDGDLEVLVGDASGVLSCFDHAGKRLWEFSGDGGPLGPALVADLYSDIAGLEIVVTSHDQHVYVLASGSGRWLWDLYFEHDLFPNSTPMLADVNGDNKPELYIGGGLHHFYRIDLKEPRVDLAENVYLHVNGAIAAADLDADGKDEVIFGNKGGALWCYGQQGFKWQHEFPKSSLYAAPTLLNLDQDPALEILLFSSRGDVQFLDTDGTLMDSAATKCGATAAPVVGDFDGDGMTDLVLTEPGGFGGTGVLLLASLNTPYQEVAGLPNAFAGSRTRSGPPPRPKPFATTPRPTPRDHPTGTTGATATPEAELRLLTGTNTWPFSIQNPQEQRLALLLNIAYPDGSFRNVLQHLYGPAGKAVANFEVEVPGDYSLAYELMDADRLAPIQRSQHNLHYAGFDSDQTYLRTLFEESIPKCLSAWRKSNPRCADNAERKRAALHGWSRELSQGEPAGQRPLAMELRAEAERLSAMARAGLQMAQTGTFVAWPYNPWAHFDSHETIPESQAVNASLNVALCGGEYESRALNLTNLCERTLDVRVLCDDIEGPATPNPAQCLEFRRAVTVPTQRREQVADALPLLDQGNILTVPSMETQQLWITVNAKNLAPGQYMAKLRLKSIEPDPTERVCAIPITVHDLHLPRPRPLRFCLWSYDGGPLGTDQPSVLEDLVEHGATVFFGKNPQAVCDVHGALTGPIDFSAHDESVRRLSPHGILLFVGSQHALKGQPFLSQPWRKAFIDYLRSWVAHLKTLGLHYGDWALYPYDEPSTPYAQTTLNLVEVAKIIRAADPNILVYTDPTSGTTMETVRMFSGLIDIWCPSSELLERFGEQFVPVAHALGKEVWFYDAAGRAKTLSCLGIYRWRFWYAWNQGFAGAGWWCYHHHGNADRWDGPNETGDFFATVYNAPVGVISSKRWEAARDGVEDYEYLYLLRETIRNAARRGVPDPPLATARRLLAELPPDIEATLHQVGRRLPLTLHGLSVYERATHLLHEARQRIVTACLEVRTLHAQK